ncbi:MAG: zinc-binding dehydrogenase [Candidatus Limnocylindria bacterium]
MAAGRRRRGAGDRRVLISLPPRYRKEDVLLLAGLLEAGSYRAVIDRSYPLEQVVEASRYVETGRKRETSSSPWALSASSPVRRGIRSSASHVPSYVRRSWPS